MRATLLVCVTSFLIGCGPGGEEGTERATPSSPSIDLSGESKAAFAELKRIPPTASSKLDRAYAEFLRRTAISDHLLAERYAEDDELKIRVLESRNRLVLDAHYDEVVRAGLEPEAVQAYYTEHADRFGEAHATVTRLLLRVRGAANDEAGQQRRQDLELLLEEIDRGDLTFDEAARQRSEDLSLEKTGGRIEDARLSDLGVEVARRLRVLPIGEHTGVLRSPQGFVVYRLESEVRVEPKPFDQVRDQVEFALKQQLIEAERARLAALAEG